MAKKVPKAIEILLNRDGLAAFMDGSWCLPRWRVFSGPVTALPWLPGGSGAARLTTGRGQEAAGARMVAMAGVRRNAGRRAAARLVGQVRRNAGRRAAASLVAIRRCCDGRVCCGAI